MFFFLTLYMQQVLHFTPVQTGVGYLAVTATSITSATISSRFLARLGAHRVLPSGMLTACVGLFLLVRISPTSGYLDILPSLLLIGGGNGASFVSMMSLAVAGVPSEDTGIASGLLNASQQVGGSLGIALLTAVAAARFVAVRPKHPTPVTLAAAATSSWVSGFLVAAILLLGATITTALLLRGCSERLTVRAQSSADALLPTPCHGNALRVPMGNKRS
jgi:MFS family permease